MRFPQDAPPPLILLVDDQSVTFRMLERLFRGEQWARLAYCQDPAEALQQIQTLQPMTVLVDLFMPVVDGLTLLSQIRAIPELNDLPVVMLSSEESPQTKAQAFEMGATDYLIKLPERIELLARLKSLVGFRQAARDLRESESRYQLLYAGLRDAVFIAQLESGEILDCNPEAERLTGRSHEALIGAPITQLHPAEEIGAADAPTFLERLLRGEQAGELSVAAPSSDAARYVDITAIPFEQGCQKRALLIYRDVSERHAAQQTLERQVTWRTAELSDALQKLGSEMEERKLAQAASAVAQSRYQELFNNLSLGVAVYRAVGDGADFQFVDFNPAAARLEGVSRDEVIGKSVLICFPGVKSFGLFDVFVRVWRSGMPEQHPISLYHDERVHAWRENYVYKLPSGELVAVYQDLTAQKRAEEDLLASRDAVQKRLADQQQVCQALQQALPGALAILDSGGVVMSANAAFAAQLGRDMARIIGQSIDSLLDLGAAKAYQQARTRLSPEHPAERFGDGERFDGAPDWMLRAVYAQDGRVIELLLMGGPDA
ncbi:hypothetical protein MAIT1_00589 [Magnetofaba australis IT-1]|uniref:PAS/PAC sensor protein n=1 Tax=Magnetofaba australis IT-1 TaxID=1434232 RepID=A0A1Y2K1H2_9PROT|nr:hypothetical protein MAIT1_00589 [Magnetofaba australis IT-1]